MIRRSTGRVPMAQPPGSDTRASPMRATSGASTQKLARILRDELVRRGGVDDVGGGDVQRLAVIGGLAGALAADHDVDAVIAEDALQQRDVGEPRHVVEDQRLVGEQARDHQGQRGVFRPRDRDRAVETAGRRQCEYDP